MRPATDGILLIDKAAGETSHDVVKKVRAVLRKKDRLKVGHAGTLDPFATGLLIILVGQGTKLSPFVMAGQKEYEADLLLGIETDTMDPTGRVVGEQAVPAWGQEHIEEAARRFTGACRQTPPAYSAVKVGGKRAYQLARKGRHVALDAKEITVHSLEILSVDLPHIAMRVRCSSGTYIRRLASDLGNALGTGGHLQTLRRTRSGPFEVSQAISSAEIMERAHERPLWENIIPMEKAVPDMNEMPVRAEIAKKVRQGWQPDRKEALGPAGCTIDTETDRFDGRFKLVCDGKLVAIARRTPADAGDEKIRIERVFLS